MTRNKGSRDIVPRKRPDLVDRITHALMQEGNDDLDKVLDKEDFDHYLRLKFLNRLFLRYHPQLDESEIFRVYKKEYNLSYGTYTKDRHKMQLIFGPLLLPDILYLKGIELQTLIRDRSLARTAGDMKSVAQFTKLIIELMGLSKYVDPKENEGSATTIITNIQINYADGSTKTMAIDFDMLEKMKPKELDQIATMLDMPSVGMIEMEKMLNPTDDAGAEV
jgi:hypothetical protein